MTKEEKKLKNIIAENPDPKKWTKWIKLAIKILVLIISAIGGDVIDISEFINL